MKAPSDAPRKIRCHGRPKEDSNVASTLSVSVSAILSFPNRATVAGYDVPARAYPLGVERVVVVHRPHSWTVRKEHGPTRPKGQPGADVLGSFPARSPPTRRRNSTTESPVTSVGT